MFWITGLSGAGKSTVAKLVRKRLSATNRDIALLDGDAMRCMFGDDLSHNLEQRRISAWRNMRTCKGISDQSINVVCATISMFSDIREWGKTNIPNYHEIYLRVPLATLAERDDRGLYAPLGAGETRNVVGLDLPWDEPDCPDLIVDICSNITPDQAADQIWNHFHG